MKDFLSRAPRRCVAWIVLWWVAAAAAAGPAAHQEPLTLATAIERAVARSPMHAALEAERDAASYRAAIEGLRPGFVLESSLENFAGSGAASGIELLETTLQLSRIVELGGKQQLRQGAAAAQLGQLGAEQALRQVELAAEVARRFIHVLSDQRMLATARRATELAGAARDVARERVAEGASSPIALSRAQIALTRALIAQEHAEHELATSRVKLVVLWGDSEADFAAASGDLFELPALEPFEAHAARFAASPELTLSAAQAQLQEARVHLASAQRAPDITLAAGIRRLESFDDQALVASFSIPLGTRRRAELAERAARADRRRVDADWQAQRLELHATLFDLYQEAMHARSEAAALHSQVKPQAEAMLAAARAGYRAGRFSQLELADAQIQLVDTEREAIRAAAQYHTLRVAIQRLTGEPIRAFNDGRAR